MIVIMYSILCCIESPKELPTSRLKRASSGSMIQYGKLKGFLVQRGTPTRSLLWIVEKIDTQIKNCALQQVPSDTRALLVDNYITLAQDYLQTSAPPSSFKCTQ